MADSILVPSITSWGTCDFEEIVFTYNYRHDNIIKIIIIL